MQRVGDKLDDVVERLARIETRIDTQHHEVSELRRRVSELENISARMRGALAIAAATAGTAGGSLAAVLLKALG